MAGWVHRRDLVSDSSVAIAPTSTVIVDIAKSSLGSVSGIVTNTSASQTLAISWLTSWDGATRWAPLAALNYAQFSEPVQPLESRHFQFDIQDLRAIRLVGQASGAGLTAVVSLQQTSDLPVR